MRVIAKRFRAIHGVDQFDITIENMKRYDRLRREQAKADRCRMIAYHVIQRENLGTIEKLFEIFRQVGADEIEFYRVIPLDPALELNPDELKRAREALRRAADRSPLKFNETTIFDQLKNSFARRSTPKTFRSGTAMFSRIRSGLYHRFGRRDPVLLYRR